MAKEHVSELRPTQIALGMKEVESKVKRLAALKPHELEDYLRDHPVPYVKSPHGELYIIDHHHLVRACWESGIEKVVLELKADLSHMRPEDFWKFMSDSHWIHPYDQFGNGPHSPELLPQNIRGLADDPYRSLAWTIREKGGFKKSEHPFCEFHWADYFRKHIKLGFSRKDFDTAIEEALHACRRPEAKKLPGYVE
jgi:hypothetical protein